MSTFIYNINSEAHPAPTMQQRYDAFTTQGGNLEDFAFLVVQSSRSLTVAVAKKVGNTLAFPTSLISMRGEGQLPVEQANLIGKINMTSKILGIAGVQQINE